MVYCAIFQWNSLLLRTIVNLQWFILTALRNLYIKQSRTLTLQSLYRIFRCPRTVENFSTHSANGYYNTHIFHRVIHQFMIQTGDPLGKTHLIKSKPVRKLHLFTPVRWHWWSHAMKRCPWTMWLTSTSPQTKNLIGRMRKLSVLHVR